ncbi:Uma2 family endonuclease [Crocosphaera sp. XPORK-15E]|uniref:Uma2 family endonuclease n=1 Tax=Crocosphaera sp. XPORK-15E TaxID=3110247 RepID=UPI002B1EB2DF|nr:Uma2 family endonuclease [Crocosphaera sp. XPORK-15E]MEA5535511.1 Uma2 family endonuclease [Crocosphaera sp. XPORK-15E]
MITTQAKLITDTWITITWENYLQLCDDPNYEKAKFYYYNEQGRIEMTPIGNDHSRDHGIICHAIYLYAGLRNIPLNGNDNCSYRKAERKEAQPDLSFYIGDNVNVIPYGTSIVDLNIYTPPNLVIEVSNTSLADDKGEKRLLYEDLGVQEYWIIDVKNVNIIAFQMEEKGSRRITKSQVLPDLEMSILVETLQKSRETNHSEVSRWLLQKWQIN